jgi:hypothetical protein
MVVINSKAALQVIDGNNGIGLAKRVRSFNQIGKNVIGVQTDVLNLDEKQSTKI